MLISGLNWVGTLLWNLKPITFLSHFLLRIKAPLNDKATGLFYGLCGVECSCIAYVAIWLYILLDIEKTKMQFTFQRRKWQNAVLKTISVKLLPFYPKPLKWIIGLPSEELWNYQMNVPLSLRYGAVHIYQIRANLLDLLFWKGFIQKWNIFEKCSSFLLLYCDKIMTTFSSLIAKACI